MQLHRAREQFEQAGIGLVLIGQATPRQATAFRRKLEIDDVDVLADESRQTYKLAGFTKANVKQLLGPQSFVSGIKHARRSGVMQGKIIGDAAQLGGAVVVDTDGTFLLEQASEHAGDTIEPADLIGAAPAKT